MQLRSKLGCRIDMCHVLMHVIIGELPLTANGFGERRALHDQPESENLSA